MKIATWSNVVVSGNGSYLTAKHGNVTWTMTTNHQCSCWIQVPANDWVDKKGLDAANNLFHLLHALIHGSRYV